MITLRRFHEIVCKAHKTVPGTHKAQSVAGMPVIPSENQGTYAKTFGIFSPQYAPQIVGQETN